MAALVRSRPLTPFLTIRLLEAQGWLAAPLRASRFVAGFAGRSCTSTCALTLEAAAVLALAKARPW